jgi:hypothetical protein
MLPLKLPATPKLKMLAQDASAKVACDAKAQDAAAKVACDAKAQDAAAICFIRSRCCR